MPDIRLNFEIHDYSTYNLASTDLAEGELRYFSNVVADQVNNVPVMGDGVSAINTLPFKDVVEVITDANVNLEPIRITGNRVKVYNIHTATIQIEIGTSLSSVIFYLLPEKEANFIFTGSVWAHKEENIITLTGDLVLPDLSGPTRIILPASGISANTTVTLPTLADNQYKQIRFDNFNTTYQLIIDGEGAETIEGFTAINLSTEYNILEGQSSEWKRIEYSSVRPIYKVIDRKAATTAGGTFNSGAWQIRDLTYEEITEIIGASLSTNRALLPPGKYRVNAFAPAFFVNRHQIALYDYTNTTILHYGENGAYASVADTAQAVATLTNKIVTITTATEFELHNRCQTSGAGAGSRGLEIGSSWTVDYERYSYLEFEKLI